MDLILLGIMIIFVLMVRRVDPIQDLAAYKNFLFVAVEDHGVRVLDTAQNPGEPIEVGMYNTPGSALGVSVREKEGNLELYVADDNRGVEMFRVSESGALSHQWFYPNIAPALDIAVQGDFAWVAAGKQGLWLLNVGDGRPGDKEVWRLENIPSAVRVSVFDDTLYVIAQDWQLFSIRLNKNDPTNSNISQPYPVGVPVHDFVVSGGRAYLATQGEGLVLLNTNQPPESAELARYKEFPNVRGVVVEGSFTFISTGVNGILALDIAQPESIIRIGELKDIQVGQVAFQFSGLDEPKINPIFRTPEAGYIVASGGYLYYTDGLSGLRVLEPRQKIDVHIADVLGGINNPEGWAEDVVVIEDLQASEEAPKGDYAFMAGGDRGLWVLDVTQKDRIKDLPYQIETKEGVKRLDGFSNAIAAFGNRVYLSIRDKGVQILDVSNPKKIQAIAAIEIGGETRALVVQGGHTLYTAGNTGLRIYDIQDPEKVRLLGSENISNLVEGIALADEYIFAAAGESGLQVINVQNKQKPTLIQPHPFEGHARAIDIYAYRPTKDSNPEFYAYIANGGGGLLVASISPDKSVNTILTLPFPGEVQDVFVHNHRLYVTDSKEGLYLFDLADPKNPSQKGRLDTPGTAVAVFGLGDFAYVADHNRGLRVINVSNPVDLREYDYFDMPTRVKDLVITADQQHAFLVGDSSGLWTLSLKNRDNPIPINLLEITGEPSSIEIDPNGNRAYIGDGSRGLYIVDLNRDGNLTAPSLAASYSDLKDVRRVIPTDDSVLVANGDNGLAVLSLDDLKKIKSKQEFKTNGAAMNLGVEGSYVYIVTSIGKIDVGLMKENGQIVAQQPDPTMPSLLDTAYQLALSPGREHLYIAGGNQGMVVINVHQPLKPVRVYQYDTPGNLQDIYISDYYLFLADGNSGIGMVYMPVWWQFTPTAQAYFSFDAEVANAPKDCVPNAQSIVAIPHIILDNKRVTHYAYVATDQCGLLTLEYSVSMELVPHGLYATPGEATFGMVARSYGRIVGKMIKGIWDNWTSLIEVPYIGKQIVMGEVAALDARIRETARLFVFGLVLVSFTLVLGLILLSFFVLPVRSFSQGIQSFLRLGLYFRGFHGTAARVREGQITLRPLGPHGPGLALVDLNSAIAIEEYATRDLTGRFRRNENARRVEAGESRFQVRVAGPGLVYLSPIERIKAAVDLRRQIRLRLQVSALTRDAIEVITNVFTGFTIGEDPEVLLVTYQGDEVADNLRVVTLRENWVEIPEAQGRTRQVEQVHRLEDTLDPDDRREIHRYIQAGYRQQETADPPRQWPPWRFDRQRVLKAVLSRPRDVSDREVTDWTELPPHVGVGIFRGLINQEFYDNLYQRLVEDEFPLRNLSREFGWMMRNQGILAYQYVQNRNGLPIREGQDWVPQDIIFSEIQELRNPKPLRARGIRLIFAGFTELGAHSEDVGEALTKFWQAEWQREVTITRADHELQSRRIVNLARTGAEVDLVNTLAMILEGRTHTREALAFRILQALESAATDPETNNLLPRDMIQVLGHIQRLLLPGPPGEGQP